MVRRWTRETKWLLGILVATTLLLWATCIPEVFTLDECNYLATVRALRAGTLFAPETAGLPASTELASFDPTAKARVIDSTPIAPTVPPLYAPLALPLSFFGFRFLVLINALAFGVVGWLVFHITRRHTKHASTAWVALATYVLGGFGLDYAQGMWPQMLSVAFTTTGVWAVLRSRRDAARVLPLMAGLALGMAAGIRYQNVVFGAALGVSLLLVSQHRVRHGLSYAAGMAGPMVATSLMNAARLGSYNPISKGSHYLKSSVGGAKLNPVVDVLATLWVRIVDYSAHPPFIAEHGHAALPKDPTTGVFLVVGGLKKSLLQSAPWIIVALVAIFLVWTARGTSQLSLGTKKQRLLRALSIPILVVLALFAWAGLERHDGWSFNQRYLLELVPLFAVATAVLVDRATDEWQATVIGGAIGVAIAAVPVVSVVPEHWFRQRALMYVPLALAVTIAVVWLGAKRNAAARRLRLPLLALCVGWAFVVHVGDDMWATRGLRDWNGFQRENIAEHLPPEGPVALIAIPPQKEALCPIQLDRDLLIVDPNIDRGEDVDALTTALLATNRRVFVVGGVPEVYLASIFRGGRRHRMVSTRPLLFAEVLTTRAVPPP